MEALERTLHSDMCGASAPDFGDKKASNQPFGGLTMNGSLVDMPPAAIPTATTSTEEGRPAPNAAVSITALVGTPVAAPVKHDTDVATVPDVGSVVEKKPPSPDMKRKSGEIGELRSDGPLPIEVLPPHGGGASQQVVDNFSSTADPSQSKTMAAAPSLSFTERGSASTGEEGGGCISTSSPVVQVQVPDKADIGQASGEAAAYATLSPHRLSSGNPDCGTDVALVPPTTTSKAIPPAYSSSGIAMNGAPSVVDLSTGGLGSSVEGVDGSRITWSNGSKPQESAAVVATKLSVPTPPLSEPVSLAETDNYTTVSTSFLPIDTVTTASVPGAKGQPAYTVCSATEAPPTLVMPLNYVAQHATLTPNCDDRGLVLRCPTSSQAMASQMPPAPVVSPPLTNGMTCPITNGPSLPLGLTAAQPMVQSQQQVVSLPSNHVMGHGPSPQMSMLSNNQQSGPLMHRMRDSPVQVVGSGPIEPQGIHPRTASAQLQAVANMALSNQIATGANSLPAIPNPMPIPAVAQMAPHLHMDQPPHQPTAQQQQVAQHHAAVQQQQHAVVQQQRKQQQQAQTRRAQQRHRRVQQQQVQAAQSMERECSLNSMVVWQRDEDLPHRKRILQEVVNSLRCCIGNDSDWRKKVPEMAKKLEQRLYHSAASFSEYNDMNTLSARLRALAHKIQRNGTQQAAVPHASQQQNVATMAPGNSQRNGPGGKGAPMNSVRSVDAIAAVSQIEQCGPSALQNTGMGNRGPLNRKVVNLNDINPIIAASVKQPQKRKKTTRESGGSHGTGQLQQQQPIPQLPFSPQLPQNLQQLHSHAISQEQVKCMRQQHQRQKLLMLHHASRCKEENCSWAPHCTSMKRLWAHVTSCRSHKCKQPHCVSSRLVLSHFRRCTDGGCCVCVPVHRWINTYHNDMNASGSAVHCNPQQQQQQQNHVREPLIPQQDPPTGKKKPVTVMNNRLVQFMQNQGQLSSSQQQLVNSPQAHDFTTTLSQMQIDLQASNRKSQKRLCPLPPSAGDATLETHGGVLLYPGGGSAKRMYTEKTGGTQGGSSSLGFTTSNGVSSQGVGVSGPHSVGLVRAKEEIGFTQQMESSSSINGNMPPTSSPGRLKKAEECTSLVEAFTSDQIVQHLKSLHTGLHLTANRIKIYVMPLIKSLMDCQFGWIFSEPVDPVQLNLPDYFHIIRNPMDLGTIRNGINNSRYRTLADVAAHVRLVFDNAMTYNQPGSDVYPVAKEMLQAFEVQWAGLLNAVEADEESSKLNGEACSLCGFEKLNFEPVAFYCNGANCNGKRIRRQKFYYSGGGNQYHWCHQCYNELRDNAPIPIGDLLLEKADLCKKKNDEIHEEPWVGCDCCKRWVHQVCALFNGRQHTDEKMNYYCPKCILNKRQKTGQLGPTAYKLGGENLKPTALSKFIEAKVLEKLDTVYLEEAQKKGCDVSEVPKANNIFIRQVSNQQVLHAVKPNFLRRYGSAGFPSEFPARSRCLLLFQEIDGVDVLLFGMYVYEYGHKCPQPNQRRVYISYLDSIFYFRAQQYRTILYKEIIIAYLEYVKNKGFHTAHIWTCPPLKGDDYILNCHPEAQRTPKVERLQQWYMTMLEDCRTRGIVSSVTDIYSEFWEDPNADPTVVPYLEGDYWIGEAENVVKDLEEGGVSAVAPSTSTSKSKSKSKTKSKGGQGAGGNWRDGDSAGRQRTHRDPVMRKIGEAIQPMRASFIVARLRDKEFEIQCMQRRKQEIAIEEAKEKVENAKRRNEMPDAVCLSLSKEEIAEDETEADEEQIDCEILDTRQLLLNLCQGNHYQFDQMRRAKHSSMMVLYHLCNPDAPKFLYPCSKCFKDINAGNRYHCSTCGDFDLCQDCYLRVGAQHDHPLKPIAIWSNQTTADKEKTKREKQQKMALQIQLLEHASDCTKPNCSFLSTELQSSRCKKMKECLTHSATCKKSIKGGCVMCRQIGIMLRVHSRRCTIQNCRVPRCRELQAYDRMVATQQQQMDDRRRQAMNEAIRARHEVTASSRGPAVVPNLISTAPA